MFEVCVGHSNDPDSASAIEEVLQQCQQYALGIPQAGILVAAFEFDHSLILERIHREFPGIALIGGTSVAEMSSVLEFQEDSIALMLFFADEVEIRAGIGKHVCQNPLAAAKEAVRQAGKTSEVKLCMTITEGIGSDGVSIVKALGSELGETVPVFGGMAADDWKFQQTYQFFGTQVLHDSLPILLFSGNLSVGFGVASGRIPIGRKGIVTKAKGNEVYEIDFQPATKFYFNYFGEFDLVGGAPSGTSIAVWEPENLNYYLRTPWSSDSETGCISYFGTIPEPSEIQLTQGSQAELLSAAKTAFSLAQANYPGQTISAAVIVSCASRQKGLGTRNLEEYRILKTLLGESIPSIGFQAFGEIAPFSVLEQTYFHNESLTVLLLGTN